MKNWSSISWSKVGSLALLLLVVPTVGVFALANGSLLGTVSAEEAEAQLPVAGDLLDAVAELPATPVLVVEPPLIDAVAEEPASVPTPTPPPTVTPEADLELSTTVDTVAPTIGSSVTITIAVANALGTVDATGVEVLALLPAGLAYESHSTKDGSYEPARGLWDVGTVGSGASVTLDISAVATSTGPTTTFAEIVAVGIGDPDSLPNNHVASEDDHDSVTVAAQPKPKLALSASVYEATGDVVVFALVLSNAGTSPATDIEVRSMPPAGLRYTGHVAQQGDYDPLSGVWTVGTVEGGTELTLHISATAEAVVEG